MKRYLLKQVQISDIRPADLNGDEKQIPLITSYLNGIF